jgi:periplasmic divalent cation tolerance protein
MSRRESTGADAIVAMTTVADMEQARSLARMLVESRLAACVTLSPGVSSCYRWEGEIHEDHEVLLWIKTRATLLPAIKDALASHHPYEVPELLALQVVDGLPSYLSWIHESTKHPEAEAP